MEKRLYFREDGLLSFAPPPLPTTSSRLRAWFDSYVSDPAHPVPYRRRPIQQTYDDRGSDWYPWLVEDQRFVQGRPDVLTWQTPPLDRRCHHRGQHQRGTSSPRPPAAMPTGW